MLSLKLSIQRSTPPCSNSRARNNFAVMTSTATPTTHHPNIKNLLPLPIFPPLTKLSVNKPCLSLLFLKWIVTCRKLSSLLVHPIPTQTHLNYNQHPHSLILFGTQRVAPSPPDILPIGGSISRKDDNHIGLSSINPNGI